MRLCKIILTFLLSLIVISATAALPAWRIVPADSSIRFTATQNNAPVTGQFKSFSGDVYFDPDQLNVSSVRVTVDMNSIDSAYKEMSDTLKMADWFNVKLFPQAVFVAHKFIKTGDKTYQAQGNLTLRDKTLPVTLDFTVEEYSANKLRVKGATTLKRTAFGVGQGDWVKTDAVKDEVQVDFVLGAVR